MRISCYTVANKSEWQYRNAFCVMLGSSVYSEGDGSDANVSDILWYPYSPSYSHTYIIFFFSYFFLCVYNIHIFYSFVFFATCFFFLCFGLCAHILWAFINFPDTLGGELRLVIYGEVYTMFVVTTTSMGRRWAMMIMAEYPFLCVFVSGPLPIRLRTHGQI